MKPILRKLHRHLYTFNMSFFFLLFWPPAYYCSLKPARYKWMIKLRRVWALLSTFCSGIIFRFEFEEPIDWTKPYVICPNHTSNLDTMMMSMFLQSDNVCFM